jgi:hypothetical protein
MKELAELEVRLDQGEVYHFSTEVVDYQLQAFPGGYVVREDVEETTFTSLEAAVLYFLEQAGWFQALPKA